MLLKVHTTELINQIKRLKCYTKKEKRMFEEYINSVEFSESGITNIKNGIKELKKEEKNMSVEELKEKVLLLFDDVEHKEGVSETMNGIMNTVTNTITNIAFTILYNVVVNSILNAIYGKDKSKNNVNTTMVYMV